jgi:hypothetical protein
LFNLILLLQVGLKLFYQLHYWNHPEFYIEVINILHISNVIVIKQALILFILLSLLKTILKSEHFFSYGLS